MEGGKILFITVLTLLSLLAVSGREPMFRGVERPGRELDCCDECECRSGMSSCTCLDRSMIGCRDGCKDCRRERGLYHCGDVMNFCPESCDYDYSDDGA